MRRICDLSSIPCALALALWLCACASRPPVTSLSRPAVAPPVAPSPSRAQTFHPEKLAEMDAAIGHAITNHQCPGAVFWLERHGTSYARAYGERALVPTREPMTQDTLFDAASLTKVVATTPAIMLLIERRQVNLDVTLQTYLPEFKGDGKEAITLRQLMTHTSGLPPDLNLNPPWSGYDTAIRLACAEKLLSPPGTEFHYSDINFFLLGEVVRRVTGQPLNEFVAREIYRPLRMRDTGFLPARDKWPRIAPTEFADGQMLRGVVHDPTARRMGGVAGHAGLFITAADLARYARLLLNGGTLDGTRLFAPETVRLMTSVQSPEIVRVRRGLGWDIDSGYSRPRGAVFPLGSFGHTGFTGTCLWIDPFSQTFWILLSNRVHPDGKGNILPLEGALGTLVAQSVIGFNFSYVPGALAPRNSTDGRATVSDRAVHDPDQGRATVSDRAVRSEDLSKVPHGTAPVPVLNGIDVLEAENFAPLKGLRVGLITNHTGTDRNRRATIDLLKNADGVRLVALFSPEHGIRGTFDAKVGDSVDEQTGLPVYSLYGERHAPTPGQLRDLDALVFDLQDVGCRFYTYTTTMGLSLEAAAKAGKKFFVLDRVNPINGVAIDGPVLDGTPSFTGFYQIPVRYGMTIGEEAKMYNAERGLQADLTVIPIQGWRRELWFDETGLPWINPSPNMRNLTEAILYPGVGLLETTAVSVGRGTDTPFEVVGAPYIDDLQLAAQLNRAGLAGVRFIPVQFTPAASVFKGQLCRGVNLLLTDRDHCDVVDVGVVIAQTLHRLYPQQFDLEKFNRLLLHPATIAAIKAGKSREEIRASWRAEFEHFKRRRTGFLLYP